MSINIDGRARWIFINGRKEGPPARIFASSFEYKSSIAWSTDSARAYSNSAVIMRHLLCAPDRSPHPLGRRRLAHIAHARGDSLRRPTALITAVGDAIPRLADPFTPSGFVVLGVEGADDVRVWIGTRTPVAGDRVIELVERFPLSSIDRLFVERLGGPLRDPAVNLALTIIGLMTVPQSSTAT